MHKRQLATAVKSALLAASVGFVATSNTAFAASSLTIFHNNDGESKLLGSGSFGGFDYFLGELNAARGAATTAGRDVLTLSSGDNFLAGLAWRASEARRAANGGLGSGFGASNEFNYYDALALTAVGYDAITLGNHDFDFGPAVLGDFISGYEAAGGTATFLSANLDFSAEPALSGFTTATPPRIASSTIISRGTEQYGVIGATTELLDTISSPGGNITIGDVATAVNAQIASLTGAGVNKIILSSHLQGISGGEEALIPLLDAGIDVIIAGGGDELLRNGPDANTEAPFGPDIDGPYPLISTTQDKGGNNIALVTTQGEYKYIGELNVDFDAAGAVTSVNGNAILVDPAASTNQAVGTFNGIDIESDILTPLAADVAALEATVVGTTEVALDGRRESVRSVETNLGNLIGDAFIWQAQQIGGLTGDPVIAFTNGGGIRNASVIAANTDLSVADVIDILPFDNSVVTLNGVTVADLVATLEKAVDGIDFANPVGSSGGFLQIAGFEFTYDRTAPEGSRLTEVRLDDGTLVWSLALGDVYGGTFDIVTNSFTAGGGDGFSELADYFANDLSVNYGDALAAYIETFLGGTIAAGDYPAEGFGRINAVPVPAAVWLFGSALGAFGFVRRRAA